ncbi:MAG: hypothetical protein ABIX01_21050 [Chitinophagaceae bacterium]
MGNRCNRFPWGNCGIDFYCGLDAMHEDAMHGISTKRENLMDKLNNKYRIPSARLQTWDYASAGLYFITICTKNRNHFFGEIEIGEMLLTGLGTLVQQEWLNTPSIRPDMHLQLGEFVVMPNHFHGVLDIGKNAFNTAVNRNSYKGVASANKYGPQSKNLGSILRGFKSAVTTFARKNNIGFNWQERYHDHIIRDYGECIRISNCIIHNIANWKDDRFYQGPPS